MSELVTADIERPKDEKDIHEKVAVEIDAGVYYEVDETQIDEDIATLEEELAQSGKKPYVLARLLKKPYCSSGFWLCWLVSRVFCSELINL